MPIQISEEVMEGLEAVRLSGATNMLDRPRVIELLDEMGFDVASAWVASNKKEYSHGIFQGFQVVEDAKSSQGCET
ncbi:MAG TPA: DUF5049 domain-containing protein [Candidatus Hydrogenedentes bacterium]|nr:DUF5049 domain-containing protein [Candidatus Hydrogenedentota bacterium]HPG68273.1 DUF5049 domain-containing protein [Candidatus Hydrogenedentota bacterium]